MNNKSRIKYIIRHKWLYILLLPGIVYLLVFNYFPMFGVVIAFKDFNFVKGIWGSDWIGFKNFEYLFSSQEFFRVFRNSIVISLMKLIFGFPAPIIIALLLNEMRSQKYKRTMQTIMYFPHFISWVVLAGLVMNVLSPSNGAINEIIKFFGGKPIYFLQKKEYFRGILVISDIWKEAGWGTIIYLAALSSVDLELYEAASIDGANRLHKLRHITLPSIAPVIVVMLILRSGSILRNGFEQIFMLYSPVVYEVADVFETYTYRMGQEQARFGFSTAVGLFQSVIGVIFIYTTNTISRRVGEGGLW